MVEYLRFIPITNRLLEFPFPQNLPIFNHDFIASHSVDSEVNLSQLGDSLMDLYTGSLSLDTIFKESLAFLIGEGIAAEEDYRAFWRDIRAMLRFHYRTLPSGYFYGVTNLDYTYIFILQGIRPTLYV